MITKKIKALFDFVDFLHSNIEVCLSQTEVFNELQELHKKRNELRPIDNYKKKLSFDKIQTELNTKFSILEESIIKPIINKTCELQICDYNDTTSLWNWNIEEIANLRNTFDEKDVPIIIEYKQKYIEFRKTPNSDCYQSIFFSDLDETLKELFDFFKDDTNNEFETFEPKMFNADSFEDAIKLAIENKNARISINNFNQNDKYANKTFTKQQSERDDELRKINKENEESSSKLQLQKTNSKDDLISSIVEKNELYSFLSVPAPNILHKNAFWHNENNEPIDCNIYHPKYGRYPGFETATKEVIVTSFNPVTIYQDSKTGKYVYCKYDLQMLCIVDEKNFINKDGKKVIKVDYLQTSNTRLAESEQDFELIYKREFESKTLIDTTETRKVFNQELINYVNGLTALHKARSTYKDIDINTLSLADRFIAYLNNFENELKNNSFITHREIILVHNLKMEAGTEEFKTSTQWFNEGGAKRKQAFYTLDKNNKNKYKPPNRKELNVAIELLKDFPNAKQIALQKLNELENL